MAWLPAKRTGKRANLTEKAGFPAGELLGITAEQIRQNTHVLAELNPQETTEQVKKYLEGLAPDEQREWDFEYIHRETGERRWFHVIAMGSDVEGRREYILVMSDRTADKQVNQALSDAVASAESASRAKSDFLTNMSHDIRTPMNAIIGFTTLAAGNEEDKERVRDYLDKILASGNHLLSLINDILDMSRIESGKIHLEETEVNLSEVLHNLKSIVSGQVRTKQLELSMDAINVSDEDVYCDKTRLNQVLLNLMSNAIKFTPAGGTVSVQLRQLPSSQSGRAPKRQKGAAARARTQVRARDAGRSPAHTARKGGGGCAVCREFEKILGRMQ